MKTTIIQGEETIITNNPDVALIATHCFKMNFVSVDETQFVSGLSINSAINGDRFSASIVFGPKPKHVLHVKGDIHYIDNTWVELTIRHMEYACRMVEDFPLLNRVDVILQEHISYYHKPEIHEYFTGR